MKFWFTVIPCLALFVGCQTANVSNFWNTHALDYSDIDAAQEQFADFAELAVAAPEQDALDAMDVLFDKMKEDPVAYYIYSEWMDGAFYNLLSPCRSAKLYGKAVERMVSDGILTNDEYAPFQQRLEWIQYNLEGSKAFVPGLSQIGTRTLFLVLDLGCPSCREALEKLAAEPKWSDIEKKAICLGNGPTPTVPGWEYMTLENASAVFDISMTPIYFVVAADGTVECGYTLAL